MVAFRQGSTGPRLQLVSVPAALALAAILSTPAAAQSEGCFSSDCFFNERIRDFQIIDRDTLVIYVGRERCSFVVDVDGLFCDLTYLPEVQFFRTRDLMMLEQTGRRTSRVGRNERVCPNTATQYSLDSFSFASTEDDLTPRGRPACEVRGVTPVSDNDLMELLMIEGIAPPPPPVGSGEISRSTREADPAAETEP